MPKAFLLTNKRYDLYNLNIPISWRQKLPTGKDDENEKDSGRIGQVNHLPDVEIEPVNECNQLSDEAYDDEIIEEPVNLSIKKLDLFNLRQLAEVSISIVPDSTSSSSTFHNYYKDDTKKKAIADSMDDISGNEIDEGYNAESTCSSSNESVSSINAGGATRSGGANHLHSCAECGKAYSTLSNLLRHRQTHRSTSDSNAVKTCPYCDKVYVSMPAFSMHLRTHNQGCKCPFCGKLFSRPWLLQGHIRTHTGEKPFECPSCNKKFADKSNLRAHTQTHSTDKPYTCSRCNKKFGLKSYLSKHVESSCMKTTTTTNLGIGIGTPSKSSKARKRLQGNSKTSVAPIIKLELDTKFKVMKHRPLTMSTSSSSPTSSIGSSSSG